MSNQKLGQIIANIISINVFAIIGILLVIAIISFYLLYTENYTWDPPNWVTLIIEIGIGLAIAGSILIYSNHQQKRFTEQQDRISNLVSEVKNLTEEQKKFREGRHRWALVLLRLELSNLHTLLVQDSYQGVEFDAKKIVDNMEQIINQSGDVIDSQFLYDINKICEIVRDSYNEKKIITENIFSNAELHNFMNKLISQIEKIYPSV